MIGTEGLLVSFMIHMKLQAVPLTKVNQIYSLFAARILKKVNYSIYRFMLQLLPKPRYFVYILLESGH